MKGIVFTLLNDLVEERFGLETWDALLDKTKLASGGVYTAGATYPDQELFSLVGALSERVNIPADVLIRAFGEYMFPIFANRYPVFFPPNQSLREFLLSIHNVVHIEVKKLYPNAGLPDFTYEDNDPKTLVMLYRSKRKLCALAEGLIAGSSTHFNQKLLIKHEVCMLHDAHSDHCRLELTFE